MPWLTPATDPTYAELASRAAISGGGGISSALLQRPPNQWLELLKQVAPVIKDYIQQKKSDEIANQLMNMESAQRAEPVMSNGQYVSSGPGMDASGVADYNAALGLQGTYQTPNRGGADAYKVNQAYRSYLSQQKQNEQKSRLMEAQITHLQQPASANRVPRYPVRLPDGRTVDVTGNEALRHYTGSIKKADPETRFNKDVEGDYGLTAEDVSGIGASDIDFYDASGKIITQKQVNESPDDAWVMGKAGDKTVRVPYKEWVKLGTRWKNLPNRAPNPAVQSYQEIQQKPQAKWQESTGEDFRPTTQYESVPTINTKEERDALPPGTVYIGPDGKKHRKP